MYYQPDMEQVGQGKQEQLMAETFEEKLQNHNQRHDQ